MNFQRINDILIPGVPAVRRSEKTGAVELLGILSAETLIGRDEQRQTIILRQFAVFGFVILELQVVDHHQQCFSRAGGVLETEFIEILFLITLHRKLIGVATVEISHKLIQVTQQFFPVAEIAVKVNFDEEQTEPLVIFPMDRLLPIAVDFCCMANKIFLVFPQLISRNAAGLRREKIAIAQLMIKMMQPVVRQSLCAAVVQLFG